MTCKFRKIRLVLLSAAVMMLAGTVIAVAANRLGDTDSDGEVTISDVTCIQMYVAELPVSSGFSEQAADVDGSGTIDITDATLIQQWLADLETPYPIGIRPTEAPTQRPTDAEGWGCDIFRP